MWKGGRRRASSPSPLFATFQEAAACCNGSAYGSGVIEAVVFRKTELQRQQINRSAGRAADETNLQSLLPVCLALGAEKKSLSVIDFGGACGAHYFAARGLLDKTISLRWHVVETPAMATRAQALADGELSFESSLSEAVALLDQPDLVLSSGTLQYVPDPYACVRELAACRPQCLAITRVPVTGERHDLITIDETRLSAHGPGTMPDGFTDAAVRVPMTVPSEEKLCSLINETHDVMVKLSDKSEVHPVDGKSISRLMILARLHA